MKGGKKALWDDMTMADVLTEKASAFINKNKTQPFFLYLATSDIHAPRLPHPRFNGTTSLGYRGDNVVQLDWCVGEIMKILKQLRLEENTILIFTSDNGPVYIDGGYEDESDKGNHKAAGIYRGGKYEIYEGGTRVPFIIRWPAMIESKVSSALVTQVDLMASFASFYNIELPEGAAMDSRNYWDAFMGKDEIGTEVVLEQTNSKKSVAIRKGHMKYLLRNGEYEMYNLELDPQEKHNIIEEQPELATELHHDLINLRETHLNAYYNYNVK
jgi:arylsulfatase A-like enzyme